MFDPSQLLIYIGVVALLFIVPGPAVILTLARSISGGAKAGVATGAGIAIGDMLHTLAAVIGLSAILMTSSLAYEVVRYLGAAYLIYLGVTALLERAENLNVPSIPPIGPGRAFRQAIVIEILNPKTALFFLAFLPQFTDPSRGAIFVMMSFAFTSLLAVCAARVAKWIGRHSSIGRWQGKFIGGIYITLGLQLALQERR